ncbi:MAG: biotin/lipoyl-containing protein, partial [Myxococcota bacterium]
YGVTEDGPVTTYWLDDGQHTVVVEDVTYRPAATQDGRGSGRLIAPLDGAVTRVLVKEGDLVEEGRLLMVVEAMKMEHRITADVTGAVANVAAQAGDQVKTKQLLVELVASKGGEA